MRRHHACLVPAIALALSAGAARASDRIPLRDAHRKAITSTRTVGDLSEQVGASIHSLFISPGNPIARLVNEHRQREAREGAAKLEDVLQGYDPRPQIRAALQRELANVELFRAAKVEVERGGPLGPEMARVLTAGGGVDAVLVVDFDYGLSGGFEFLVVRATATLLPTSSAADPALEKAFGASTRDLPMTPLYRSTLMTSAPAPGEGEDEDVTRWTGDRGAAARLAIEGGIAEVARLLAWDLEQGPATAPRGSRVELPQFGEDFEAALTRRHGDRAWYRGTEGELVSMGDAYPGVELAAFAPPSPADAADAAAPAAVPPIADGAGRLTFGFASAERTLQGGAVEVTQYSERAGDVELSRKRFAEGALVVTGQVGLRKGSAYAGLGPRWQLQQGGAPVDARKFQSVTVRLGATTRALRVRLSGRVPPGEDDACHPVYVLEDVDEPVKEYAIPLSKFAPESWCKAKGREVQEILPELTALEVVSNRITERPLTLRVGATTFNP